MWGVGPLTEIPLDEAFEICTQHCKDMDAPLAVKLNTFAREVKRLAPGFADIADRMVGRLQTYNAGARSPSIGEPMPPFVLPDENGDLVSLGRLLESGATVVTFHRGHWCPYCRISANALAKIEEKLIAQGGKLVVITPEVQRYSKQLKAEAGAGFPVLTDLDCGYALQLELAIKINDEKRHAMIQAGCDVSQFHDNDNWILPIPATFVIGADGIVKARFVDPDYRKRMEIGDLLSAVRGLA
jgi:peroxiredoxin